MRKIYLLLIISFFITTIQAQTSINLDAAGNLANKISEKGLNPIDITHLTITGKIDARDFKYMRDNMTCLSDLDIQNTTIVEYTGADGPYLSAEYTYRANIIPPTSFINHENLASIVLPEGTIKIDDSALNNCKKLSSVVLPSGLKTIGTHSFSNSGILSIIIPEAVTSIEDFAFSSSEIQEIEFTGNSSLINIGRATFSSSNLKSIKLPEQVRTIGEQAFSNCLQLKLAEISASVTEIGRLAFNESTAKVIVNDNNPNYSSLDGILYNKNKTLLIFCPFNIEGHLDVLKSVTDIEEYAFHFCRKLTSINLPGNLRSIGTYGFYSTGLTAVIIPKTVSIIGQSAFGSCTELISINIPSSLKKIEFATFQRCDNLKKVTFDEFSSLNVIDMDAFSYCSKLESLIIPASVDSIKREAFKENFSLKTLLFEPESSLSYVGSTAFTYTSIKILNLPSSLVKAETGAFAGNSQLEYVSIPISLASIGYGGTFACPNLKEIYTYNPVPLKMTGAIDMFNSVDKTKCKLYVPAGSIEAYKEAAIWQDFENIGEIKEFTVSSTIVKIDENNEETVLDIQSNTEWAFSCDADWLTIEQTSRSNSQLILKATENFTGAVRYATITITPPDAMPKEIVVSQQPTKNDNHISNNENTSVKIYPNPVTNGFYITGISETASLEITSTNGKLLLNKTVTNGEYINMSSYGNGVYIVRIKGNDIYTIQKILKR